MRITRKDKEIPTEFKMLSEGTVFEYEDEVYVKTMDVGSYEYRGVDLKNGLAIHFLADAEVMPLDAELIVRGKCE